jgi:hypothetical protein
MVHGNAALLRVQITDLIGRVSKIKKWTPIPHKYYVCGSRYNKIDNDLFMNKTILNIYLPIKYFIQLTKLIKHND